LAVIVLDVKVLSKGTAPSGLVRPVSVAQTCRTPAPVLCTSIVFESKKPEANGGVPVALAVMLQVPSGKALTLVPPATGPAIRVGAFPPVAA
jgi:hypothetical protein